eukprot:scaffold303_cov145-Skeletonema_dohrnii-CCMP3373.AAC.3
MVWTEYKDAGKIAFSQGNFQSALSSYLTALEELTSEERRDGSDKSNDKQILLSNVVACRLKIGGEDMATQAIEEAKQDLCSTSSRRTEDEIIRKHDSIIWLREN